MTTRQISMAHPSPLPPIHAALAPFPAVCFTLALATDVAYWRTANLMWSNFSSWLLLAGLVTGVAAVVAGAVDALVRRRWRRHGAWVHAFGSLLVLVVALVNSLVHAGDGWRAVVPWGLVLSAVTVVLVVAAAWLGRSLAREEGLSHA